MAKQFLMTVAAVLTTVLLLSQVFNSSPRPVSPRPSPPSPPEAVFRVNITVFSTIGVGDVIVEVHRVWAPNGAARFRELVESQFFDGAKFFRVLKKFIAQTGVNKDPLVTKKWKGRKIIDDSQAVSNKRGTLSFASSGKDSRQTQIFFNTGRYNTHLDTGFMPFGHVLSGMEFIDALYNGYGEGGKGKGPNQGKITQKGNAYLDQFFPNLSSIISARIME